MNNLNRNFFIGQLLQGLSDSLDRTLYVSLYNNIQFLDIALMNLTEQIIQRHAGTRLLKQLVAALSHKCGSNILRFFIGVCYKKNLTGIRDFRETLHFNRTGRSCFSDLMTVFIHHCTDTAGCGTAGNVITDMQCTLLYQYTCDRAFALVQFCLENKCAGFTLRICLKFHNLCCQQNHLQQVVNSFM